MLPKKKMLFLALATLQMSVMFSTEEDNNPSKETFSINWKKLSKTVQTKAADTLTKIPGQIETLKNGITTVANHPKTVELVTSAKDITTNTTEKIVDFSTKSAVALVDFATQSVATLQEQATNLYNTAAQEEKPVVNRQPKNTPTINRDPSSPFSKAKKTVERLTATHATLVTDCQAKTENMRDLKNCIHAAKNKPEYRKITHDLNRIQTEGRLNFVERNSIKKELNEQKEIMTQRETNALNGIATTLTNQKAAQTITPPLVQPTESKSSWFSYVAGLVTLQGLFKSFEHKAFCDTSVSQATVLRGTVGLIVGACAAGAGYYGYKTYKASKAKQQDTK